MTCNLKLRGFSWKQGINGFTTVVASSRVSVLCLRICLETPPTHFHQDNRRLAHLAFSVPPSQLQVVRSEERRVGKECRAGGSSDDYQEESDVGRRSEKAEDSATGTRS